MAGDRKSYTREEAQAILGRALEAQVTEERLTHDELLATAKEVGVSAEALEAAARSVGEDAKHDAAEKQIRRDDLYGMLWHGASYVAVNALLVFINLWIGGPFWAIWPLVGWGFGLLMHVLAMILRRPEDVAKEAKRREERQIAREERRQLKQRRRASTDAVKKSALEFERIALKGVSEILSATARGIEEASRESEEPVPKVRVDEPKAARVETPEADELDEEDEASPPEKRARR